MKEIKTGSIPTTEQIVLESCKEQWSLFNKDLISEFSTTGIIVIDRQPEAKVRVTIAVVKIIMPGEVHMKSTIKLNNGGGFDANSFEALERTDAFFTKEADGCIWIFLGYIKGKKNTPVIISHYEKFNYSVYSIVSVDEVDKFFPDGIPQNSALN